MQAESRSARDEPIDDRRHHLALGWGERRAPAQVQVLEQPGHVPHQPKVAELHTRYSRQRSEASFREAFDQPWNAARDSVG